MKTLIVHPEDASTTFLSNIYKNIPNQTLITGGISKDELKELIKEHDRVMMMGHGCPTGLFSVGRFKRDNKSTGYDIYTSLIIDRHMVPLLAEKEHNVFIWCWADQFVENNNLKGFSSGMFISEVGEANAMKVYGTDQDIIDESNYGFANIVNKYFNDDSETIYNNVMKEYGLIAEENPVALYNHNRIKLFN